MSDTSEERLVKIGRIGNGKHDGNLVYNIIGLCPTLLARDYKAPVKILIKNKGDLQ